MFYKTDLLVKTGGEFTIIWLLAHGKEGKSKISMNNSINEMNIAEKCEALLKYLPTGELNNTEIQNKMSLYLLAVLQHGIVIAFSRKTDIVLKRLIEAVEKLFKPTTQKPTQKRRASEDGGPAKTKKKRKPATALPAIDEEEEEEGLIDLRNLPTERISNRNRATDLRQITLTEYDHQPQDFFEPDLRDIENMMQLENLDQVSEQSREVIENAFSRPGSQVASINDEMRSLIAELANDMGFNDLPNVDDTFQLLDQNEMEPPRDFADQPMLIEIENVAENEEPIAEIPSLQLPELTETQIRELERPEQVERPPVRRRRRNRQLIVDEEIEISDEQMRQNLANYDDIVMKHPRAKPKSKRPTLADLFNPVSVYLPDFHPFLASMLKDGAKNALANMKEEERRRNEPVEERRESAAEIARRASTAASGIDRTSVRGPDEIVPIGDFNPEPIVEPLPTDFDDMFQLNAPVNFEPVQPPIESQDVPYNVTMDQTVLPVESLEANVDYTTLNEMDAALFNRIKERQRGRPNVEFMDFAERSSKKAIARDFVNMLHLLKRRAIKVEQNVAYGPILVEVNRR